MKKIMSNKLFRILFYIVDFIVIWALLDWIISLFTHKPFTFTLMSNVVYPAVAGVVSGLIDPISFTKKK